MVTGWKLAYRNSAGQQDQQVLLVQPGRLALPARTEPLVRQAQQARLAQRRPFPVPLAPSVLPVQQARQATSQVRQGQPVQLDQQVRLVQADCVDHPDQQAPLEQPVQLDQPVSKAR